MERYVWVRETEGTWLNKGKGTGQLEKMTLNRMKMGKREIVGKGKKKLLRNRI
jgi:hypothetical protein